MKKLVFVLVVAVGLMATSCSTELMRASVISTKSSHSLKVDKSAAREVKSSKIGFLGIGVTLQNAIDKALKEAGPEYDILLDAVIDLKDYVFAAGYEVRGLAINSAKLKAQLGNELFNELLNGKPYYSKLGE